MDNLISTLRPFSQVRLFKKGSTVLFQGEIPQRAYIVREGVIRAYTIKTSGEESIVAFFTKGDIFPLPWLLDTTANTLFYYDAISDARLISFSKEDFSKTITSNTSYLVDMLKYLNKQYTALLVRITGLEQSRAIEKISFTFYYLLFRYGHEKNTGVFEIDLKLNHLMLANLTGLTRESVTTNLKILKNKGVVTYSHSVFTVHKQKLENFIGEDGFRELDI